MFSGKLPDIHGVAVDALVVKMVCVAAGLLVAFLGFKRSTGTVLSPPRLLLVFSFVLGATALSAAAFLRWFS